MLATFEVGIFLLLISRDRWIRAAQGHMITKTLLVAILIACAGSYASDIGRADAEAVLWDGSGHHEVTLYASASERLDNRTYLLVALHGGHYYLRDVAMLEGRNPTVFIVAADDVHHAEWRRLDGR